MCIFPSEQFYYFPRTLLHPYTVYKRWIWFTGLKTGVSLKKTTAAIFLIDQKVADSIHPPIYVHRSPRSMVLCDESVTKLMSHCLCWFWLVMHLSIFNLECTAVSVFTAILMPNQCRSSLTDSTGVENNRLCNVFDSRFGFFSSYINADVLLIVS